MVFADFGKRDRGKRESEKGGGLAAFGEWPEKRALETGARMTKPGGPETVRKECGGAFPKSGRGLGLMGKRAQRKGRDGLDNIGESNWEGAGIQNSHQNKGAEEHSNEGEKKMLRVKEGFPKGGLILRGLKKNSAMIRRNGSETTMDLFATEASKIELCQRSSARKVERAASEKGTPSERRGLSKKKENHLKGKNRQKAGGQRKFTWGVDPFWFLRKKEGQNLKTAPGKRQIKRPGGQA